MDTENQPGTAMDPVKLGKITMIIAAASAVVLLLLSDGYDPRFGFVANLYYKLTFYQDQWFCHTVDKLYGDGTGNIVSRIPDGAVSCTDIIIHTKYLVLICFMVATYGFLMFKQLAPNPAPHVRAWASRAWNAVKKMHATVTQDINNSQNNRPDGY